MKNPTGTEPQNVWPIDYRRPPAMPTVSSVEIGGVAITISLHPRGDRQLFDGIVAAIAAAVRGGDAA